MLDGSVFSHPQKKSTRPLRTAGVTLALSALVVLGGGTLAHAAEAPVGLGTAESYAVIGGQDVTNTGPTIISGDVGLHPGSSVTGFPPGIINGTLNVANAAAIQAQLDVTTAYNDAAGRATTETLTDPDLVGLTLVPGVYEGGALELSGTLTLEGGVNDVFIFKAASTLITGSASSVQLTGGVRACNVFWQVGSSATLGTGSSFVGTVLALTSVTATTAATIEGRLFARNGSVTLDTNVITPSSSCPVINEDGGGGGDDNTPPGGVDLDELAGTGPHTAGYLAVGVALVIGGVLLMNRRPRQPVLD